MMDMGYEQTQICMWAEFYHKVFQLDDIKRPSAEIIDDDDLLDQWMSRQREENRRELADFYRSQESLKKMRSEKSGGRRTTNTPGNIRASRRHG